MTAACTDTQNPRTHVNPHPKMRYDITLTIENAPGPFDSVSGFMQYEVHNLDCVPETGIPVMNPLRLPPMANPRILFHKVSENAYMGTVYFDYFHDEDYFGLGICRWSLMSVGTELKINSITFVSHISPRKITSQGGTSTYFVRQTYLNSHDISASDIGWQDRSAIPLNRQADVFSITLTAKEITP